jgi:ankyrin repeat protein
VTGTTPLLVATTNGWTETARLLLENDNFVINLEDRIGKVMLQSAIQQKTHGIMELLLDHAAKLNLTPEYLRFVRRRLHKAPWNGGFIGLLTFYTVELKCL